MWVGFLLTVDTMELGVEWVWSWYLGKGVHLVLGFNGEFDVWIYGIEVLLKFVDLIFPGGTVDIINMPKCERIHD